MAACDGPCVFARPALLRMVERTNICSWEMQSFFSVRGALNAASRYIGRILARHWVCSLSATVQHWVAAAHSANGGRNPRCIAEPTPAVLLSWQRSVNALTI